MDDRIMAAFRDATVASFSEMFQTEVKSGSPREVETRQNHAWDITGLVGLAGQVQGVVALRLTSSLASALLAGSGVRLSGEGEAKALQGGLVGELANILAGRAVSSITNLEIDIAPPVVVRGHNHRIGWPAIAPVLALDFSLPEGDFELDLCVRA